MVDYAIANQIRPFQAPDILGLTNTLQGMELNQMRSQQLTGEEREKNAMRALFSDPNFNPADPAQARRILEVAPRSGHATYSALLRGYADQRAADASVRAGAASARQAELANAEIELKNFDLQRRALAGIALLPETERPAAWTAWRAQTETRLPRTRGNIPREYSDSAYLEMISTADQIAARNSARIAEQNKPPADFTLRPGETRFRGTGQPITTAPERPVRDPARETKIQDIMDTFGVDRRTAVGIESGVLRPIADPVTGQTRLIDLTNNTFRETTPAAPAAPAPPAPAPLVTGPRANITPPPAAEPAPAAPAPAPAAEAPPAPRRTLFEMAQMPLTTGATPALMQAGQNVLGQIGANIVTPEFTERRQAFSNMQNELIRAVINNPRFPVAEQERIRREINIEPGVLLDPQTLLARIKSLDTTLRSSLANREREGEDTSLPVETRRNARAAANDIKNFLATLGVPQDQSSTAAPAAPPPRRNALDRRTQTRPQRLRYNLETGELEPVQ
jgi:hypothetical protein